MAAVHLPMLCPNTDAFAPRMGDRLKSLSDVKGVSREISCFMLEQVLDGAEFSFWAFLFPSPHHMALMEDHA